MRLCIRENLAMHFFSRLLPFLLGTFICFQSQAIDFKPVAPSSTAPTDRQVDAQLLIHAPHGIAANTIFYLGVKLTHKPGWHTYWINPGDTGLPTSLTWKLPKGMQASPIQWPLPQKLTVGDFTNYGFEGEVLLVVPIKVASGFQASTEFEVQLDANWLACETACIPEEAHLQARFPTRRQSADQAAFEVVFKQQPLRMKTPVQAQWSDHRLDMAIPHLPTSWQGKTVEAYPLTKEVLASSMERNGSAAWSDAVWQMKAAVHDMNAGPVSTLPVVLVSRSQGAVEALEVTLQIQGPWPKPLPVAPQSLERAKPASPAETVDVMQVILACLGALVGGLLLNLMPCVLPVLSIKALSLVTSQLQPEQRQREGMAFALGTVSFMTLLGLALMALRAAGTQLGWGFQLQSPWMVLALSVLFTLMALNLWGVFEWPSLSLSVSPQTQRGNTLWQAFGTGALTVVVASPCTAPFMGASLGLALTLPTWAALPIFVCLGIGLALPLALLSWIPQLGARLPQPGAWMIRFRQGLGFPMLGTALWLLWVLSQQTQGNTIGLVYALLLALSAALATQHLGSAWRWLWRIMALAIVAVSLYFLFPQMQAQPASAPATTHAGDPSGWPAWSPQAVEQALQRNKAVFIDFTAAWCITCQFNEKTVLQRADVKEAMQAKQVVAFKADWTRQDPRITQALKALGRSGVPVYVLQAPNRPPQVFSEILDAQDLLAAIQALP